MCIVAYSCDTVIMFGALSLKLMYRHFNKYTSDCDIAFFFFLLFQYASTIVTYLIVLVQFDQSDKSQNACRRNVTNWVTWRLELVWLMWQRKTHIPRTIIIDKIIIIVIIISIIIIIIIIIITNTISTTIQASACCKWQMFVSRRASTSIHVTEQACWGKSINLDIWNNCRAAMSGM